MRCIEDIEDILNDEKSTPVNKKLREQKQRKTKWPINNPKTRNYLLQLRIFQSRKNFLLFLCELKFNI